MSLNTSSDLFACYKSGQNRSLVFIPYVPDTTPKIKVTSALEQTIGAEGGELTFNYELKNLEGKTLTATPSVDYLTASVSSNVVTVTVQANKTTEERTATITFACEGAESKAVTVKQAAAEQGGGETPETKTWKLVTSASTLKAGDKLAIVSTSKGKIASATISDRVMGQISVSIANNSFVSLPSGAAELTLGGSSGSWTLTNASGKKLGATAVKKVAWDSGTMTWTITIADNGDATIQNTTSSYGRFLYNVSSPRFTTYTSNATATMLLPQIYRYE